MNDRDFSVGPQYLLDVMHAELQLTVGCTDPSAIGLACAASASAYSGLKSSQRSMLDLVSLVKVEMDRNLYKNASAARIPGTGGKGIPLAIALGILLHDTSMGLRMFNTLPEVLKKQAMDFICQVPMQISINEKAQGISILATIKWKDNTETAALIQDKHDWIQWAAVDGEKTYFSTNESEKSSKVSIPPDLIGDVTLSELIARVAEVPLDKLNLIAQGFSTNLAAMGHGSDEVSSGSSDSILIQQARTGVSDATKARMNGENIAVMACGGSGNHGLTFFLTLWYGWRMSGILPERSLQQAALLGIQVLHSIKQATGVLTPMCGCAISSALAVASALTWGLGGDVNQMLQAMNMVFSTLGGIVCDGAKPACSYKTSLSAQIAIEAARMAVSGVVIDTDEGLGADTFYGLLGIIRRVHLEGMNQFDSTMVSIIKDRFAAKGNVCV
jgi:L-cysteine desulfidase